MSQALTPLGGSQTFTVTERTRLRAPSERVGRDGSDGCNGAHPANARRPASRIMKDRPVQAMCTTHSAARLPRGALGLQCILPGLDCQDSAQGAM
jgi:hypothetical protein